MIQELLKKEKGDLAARIAVTAALQGRFYRNRLTALAVLKRYASYGMPHCSGKGDMGHVTTHGPMLRHGPCRTQMK